MRDGESSSFPSATQPLNPNNPYSPDGKSLLTVETHLRTGVTDGMCVTRLCPDSCFQGPRTRADDILGVDIPADLRSILSLKNRAFHDWQ